MEYAYPFRSLAGHSTLSGFYKKYSLNENVNIN